MFKWLFGKKDEKSTGSGGGSTSPEVVSLSRAVNLPVERAFAVFVDEFGSWWPRERSLSKDKLKAVKIEAKMGGRCLEERTDGGTVVWGKVLTVDRPNHIVIAWQITAEGNPEPEETMSSRLDIRFMAESPERTNVLVVHRDFFRHGDGWQKYSADMGGKKGWPALIEGFVKKAGG